jgi:lysophospholipid acyltransferase (LPLAT)-like uncharacterized protein
VSFGIAALAAVIATLVRIVASTWRFRLVNASAHDGLRASGRPFVYAIWHGSMLPLLWHHRGCGAVLLISRSRDGDLIARTMWHFGYQAIRGSTSRGAARALLTISRELQTGQTIALSPDGPRGPARIFAPGAIAAAGRARAPILGVGCAVSSAWHARSWDRFTVPLPFARIAVAYAEPEVPVGESGSAIDLESAHFAALIDEATSAADRALDSRASSADLTAIPHR